MKRTNTKCRSGYTGRAGGLIGGPARARVLSPERRREIARLGGKACARNRRQREQASA